MRKLILVSTIAVTLLPGCTSPQPEMDTPIAPPPTTTPATVHAPDISTLQEGITWGESLSPSTPDLAAEMRTGINKIGELVPAANLYWEVNNDIGQRIVQLNHTLLVDPDVAATKIDDVQAIVADLKAAL